MFIHVSRFPPGKFINSSILTISDIGYWKISKNSGIESTLYSISYSKWLRQSSTQSDCQNMLFYISCTFWHLFTCIFHHFSWCCETMVRFQSLRFLFLPRSSTIRLLPVGSTLVPRWFHDVSMSPSSASTGSEVEWSPPVPRHETWNTTTRLVALPIGQNMDKLFDKLSKNDLKITSFCIVLPCALKSWSGLWHFISNIEACAAWVVAPAFEETPVARTVIAVKNKSSGSTPAQLCATLWPDVYLQLPRLPGAQVREITINYG